MNVEVKVRSRAILQIPVIGALAVLLSATDVLGRTNEEPRILFLHLQFQGESLSVIKFFTRPGHLKTPSNREDADALRYELTDANGGALWQGVMEDPRHRRVEHAGPAGSGDMRRQHEKLGDAEFMVRVPVLADARQIEFYMLTGPPASDGTKRKSLGKFRLPNQ